MKRSITRTTGSLRRRLLWGLIPALVVAIAVGGITSYFVARHSADFAYDQALVAAAADIASGVDFDDGRPSFDLSPQSERILRSDARDDIFFSVWMGDGSFIGGDRDLVMKAQASDEAIVSGVTTFRGKQLRAISLPFTRDAASFHVTVGETTRKRRTAAWTAFAQMVTPTTLVLLLACLIVWVSVRGGLRPLGQLQSEIESRSELDLSPIDVIGAPLEVRSLMRALNRLLMRLAAETRMHQSFVADAAHQLRTPLAGIQAQIDLLALNCRPEDKALVSQLRLSVARAIRLSNQLLSLARSEKDAAALALKGFDIADLVGQAADGWVHRAIAAQIDLGFDLRPAFVHADPYLLRELLENLVDNALRYTPERGLVTVSTSTDGDMVQIAVEDNGPGVPEDLLDKIFERFYRFSEEAATGSGLGLAIVRQIAERHEGRVSAHGATPAGGMRVTVRLPMRGPGRTPRTIAANDIPTPHQSLVGPP